MKVYIVIPAFNEGNRLEETLHTIYSNFNPNYSISVIVASDGSTDETEEITQNLSNKYDLELVSYSENQGKGYALKQGVKRALELAEAENLGSGDYYVYICDADLSTPITELQKFLDAVKEGDYDVVIGSRAVPGAREDGGFLRMILGKVGNRLINLALDLQLNDTQCGFKLFKPKAAEYFLKLSVYRWGFDFELLYLLKRDNFKIKELPVKWIAENKYSTFKPSGYITTLVDLFKVWWRHVRFSKSFFESIWRQYGRIIRYAIVGFTTVFIDFFVFAIAQRFDVFSHLELSFVLPITGESSSITIPGYAFSQIPATALSLLFNYTSHKLWTFGSKEFSWVELTRYLVAASFNAIAQLLILYICIDVMGLTDVIAKAIAITIIVTWNFFLLKLLVYKVK